MTLAELRKRLQNRIADAEAMSTTAPVADTLKLVVAELGQLSNGGTPHRAQEPEKLLTAKEVAETLSMTSRWVYDHASALPFTRRLGSKAVRFSSRGLEKYLAESRP